jgi:hypothetical protein
MVKDDFTIHCEFKTTSASIGWEGSGWETGWWNGLGLVDGEMHGVQNDFGLSIAKGRVMFGIGNPATTIITSTTYNDDNWHTIVASRERSSGTINLWADGVHQGAKIGNTNSLDAPPNIDIGRIRTGTYYFVGSIRNVLIYDEVFTPANLPYQA